MCMCRQWCAGVEVGANLDLAGGSARVGRAGCKRETE